MMNHNLRLPLAAAVALLSSAVALAQVDPHYVIDGPGIGDMINVLSGTPNVSGPGSTSGTVQSHGGACPAIDVNFMGTVVNTDAHFHGTLNGSPDPDPFGCGWGRVAPVSLFSGPPAPGPLNYGGPNGSDELIFLNLPFFGPRYFWSGRDSQPRGGGPEGIVYDEQGNRFGGDVPPLPTRDQGSWRLTGDDANPPGDAGSSVGDGTSRDRIRQYVQDTIRFGQIQQDAQIGDLDGYLLIGGSSTTGLRPRGGTGWPETDDWDDPAGWPNSVPQLPARGAPPLDGDFNGDGVVNASDYLVWQQNMGQTGGGLAADGNNDGVVDQSDFDMWKNNYGAVGSPPPVGEDQFGGYDTGVSPNNQLWGDWFIIPDPSATGDPGSGFGGTSPADPPGAGLSDMIQPFGWGEPPPDGFPPPPDDVWAPLVVFDCTDGSRFILDSPCPGMDAIIGGDLDTEIGPLCGGSELPGQYTFYGRYASGTDDTREPLPTGQDPPQADFNDALKDAVNDQTGENLDRFKAAMDQRFGEGTGAILGQFVKAPNGGAPLPNNAQQGLGNAQQHQQEQNLQRDRNAVNNDGAKSLDSLKDLVNDSDMDANDKRNINTVLDFLKPQDSGNAASESRARGNANAVKDAAGNSAGAKPSVEEKPGGTTVKKDGNGGTTTRTPNGSTVQKTPAGPTKTVSPSGIVTEKHPSGMTRVTVPLGGGKILRTTTMPDGRVIKYNSTTGQVHTKYPDGREMFVRPNAPPRYRNWPAGQ